MNAEHGRLAGVSDAHSSCPEVIVVALVDHPHRRGDRPGLLLDQGDHVDTPDDHADHQSEENAEHDHKKFEFFAHLF